MGKVIEPSEITSRKSGDSFLEGDIYSVTAETPEELRTIQAYTIENPGTTFFVEYDFEPSVSVDVMGPADEEESYNRLLGGGKEPVDGGTKAIITSAADCYQDFKREIYQELGGVWPEEREDLNLPERNIDEMPAKEIYLDEGEKPQEQRKVVRTAARMDPNQTFGAIWRENYPSEELYELMEETDGKNEEEWRENAYPVGEDVGEQFWKNLTEELEEVDIEDLEDDITDPEKLDYEGRKEDSPWCATDIGRETTNKRTPGWPVGVLEERQ